jgi:hypothetical protein
MALMDMLVGGLMFFGFHEVIGGAVTIIQSKIPMWD